MLVIGVTGGLGSGKSTVSAAFKQLGAAVVDADAIAYDLMQPRRVVWREVVQCFGKAILKPNGSIDRQRLAQKVFRSSRCRRRLESIVHPRVLRAMQAETRRLCKHTRVVVWDIPLLFEARAQKWVDYIIVVNASRARRIERLRKKWGWSHQEVQARSAAQWPLSAKVALADSVIDNSGTQNRTRTQVKHIWKKLKQKVKS